MLDTVAPADPAPDAAGIVAWAGRLAAPAPAPACDDSERIDRIRALEELKSAAAAAQAREAAALDASVRARRASEGMPAALQGKGVGA